jgi:hypothetical protein
MPAESHFTFTSYSAVLEQPVLESHFTLISYSAVLEQPESESLGGFAEIQIPRLHPKSAERTSESCAPEICLQPCPYLLCT